MISNGVISVAVVTAIFADLVCPFHLSREIMRTKIRSKCLLRAQSSSHVDFEVNRSSPTTDLSEKSGKDFLAPYGSQFLSPTFNVYIEDTDAYGVMYNANYLRAYERAMSHYHRGLDALSNEKSRRWILSEINNQKFLSSPGLGEEYVVRGELLERPSVDEEVWKVELTSEQHHARKVHNSATITLSRSSSLVKQGSAEGFDGNGITFEKKFTSYHDEFDAHHYDPTYSSETNYVRTHLLPNQHIPLRNAMNFFERSRTDYLGGPGSLRKMQIEDDLLWVVAGIDSGKLFWNSFVLENRETLLPDLLPESCMESKESANYADEDRDKLHDPTILTVGMESNPFHPKAGSELTVQTNFVAKRRGMIIVCHHRLWMDVGDLKKKTRRLLAQSTVTIMALKGSTRKPTSKLPQWLLDIISAPHHK